MPCLSNKTKWTPVPHFIGVVCDRQASPTVESIIVDTLPKGTTQCTSLFEKYLHQLQVAHEEVTMPMGRSPSWSWMLQAEMSLGNKWRPLCWCARQKRLSLQLLTKLFCQSLHQGLFSLFGRVSRVPECSKLPQRLYDSRHHNSGIWMTFCAIGQLTLETNCKHQPVCDKTEPSFQTVQKLAGNLFLSVETLSRQYRASRLLQQHFVKDKTARVEIQGCTQTFYCPFNEPPPFHKATVYFPAWFASFNMDWKSSAWSAKLFENPS